MREDLSVFFADFATTVTRASGSSFLAVVDSQFASVGDLPIESSAPSLIARTIDVSGLAHGAEIEVEGVRYAVRGIEPDGTGMTTLRLESL